MIFKDCLHGLPSGKYVAKQVSQAPNDFNVLRGCITQREYHVFKRACDDLYKRGRNVDNIFKKF